MKGSSFCMNCNKAGIQMKTVVIHEGFRRSRVLFSRSSEGIQENGSAGLVTERILRGMVKL